MQTATRSGGERRATSDRRGERVCSIHVGTHKTGTTSIQAFLGANDALFASRGVLIPRAGRRDPAYGAHHNVAWELNGDPRFDPAFGGLDALAAELSASDASAACVSSEDFELLWARTDDALVRLRDAVVRAGFQPRVVVYVRSQSSYCESMYAELVKDGYRTPFDEYVNDVLRLATFRRGPHVGTAFDYERLLDTFAAAFGHDAIVVRPYRDGGSQAELLTEFAAQLAGAAVDTSQCALPPRLNSAPTFAGVLSALGADPAGIDPSLGFAPLAPRQTLRVGLRFLRSNLAIAWRYGTFVSPLKSRASLFAAGSTALFAARCALAAFGGEPPA